MGVYTILDDGDLDKKIGADIALCRDEIIRAFRDNLLSLALIGGYGRGEGGVIKSGNVYLPCNNYDFLIVLKKLNPWDKKKIKRYLDKLKSELDKKLLTIFEYSFLSKKEVRTAKNIMIYQDIYNASRTIYGKDMRELLPASVALPLPMSEALKVIRNRSMLLLFGKQRFEQKVYRPTPQQIKIWHSKAVIGFGDAMLIAKKKYVTGYFDKMKMIQDLSFPEIFRDETDYISFKKVHAAASLYRLKGEDTALMDDLDRITGLLEQIHLWVVRKYTEDPGFDWEKLAARSFYGDHSLVKMIRNARWNIIKYGIMQNPKNILIDPADRLFKILPLVLYEPDFDFLKTCRSELGMNEKADLDDIQKRCINIFENSH